VLTEPQDIISKTDCNCFLDSCCEQNKNMVIYTLCCALDNTGMSRVTNHRFWVLGHTFLPNDGDLGVTDTKSDLAKHARINLLAPEFYN